MVLRPAIYLRTFLVVVKLIVRGFDEESEVQLCILKQRNNLRASGCENGFKQLDWLVTLDGLRHDFLGWLADEHFLVNCFL